MKSRAVLMVLLIGLLLIPTNVSSSTYFHSSIKNGSNFNWHAEAAELRDLSGDENYEFGIGGINIDGGDILVVIKNMYSEFDFFNDSVLFEDVTVEGDMSLGIPTLAEMENFDYNSSDPYFPSHYPSYFEYHLLILPIEKDGIQFFNFLFDNTNFIENITLTNLVRTDISENSASYVGNYSVTHTANYTWSLEDGRLMEKEVTSESGKRLRVVQGEGSGFGLGPNPINFPSILIGITTLFMIVISRRRMTLL